MNILHYNLGIPPFRTGGLTKYSIDLALAQSMGENNIYLLYPSGQKIIKKSFEIKKCKDYKKIKCYKIENSLPITLLFGIKEPKKYLENFPKNKIKFYFQENKIEIFHIHTLMGLPKEFLEVAKDLKIKIIYTTHDYFGLCPKVNLIDKENKVCKNSGNGKKCYICNYDSPKTYKINLLSSGFHKLYKKIKILKKIFLLKKQRISQYTKIVIEDTNKENEYKLLEDNFYYKFSLVDIFHFNSLIAKKNYEKRLGNLKGEIIYISHNNLKKYKNLTKKKSVKIRLGFFGTSQKIKGLDYLLSEFNKLKKDEKEKVILKVYGNIEGKKTNSEVTYEGSYVQNQLEKIYNDIDYTIIPSIWDETFNLVSLESKFYKTPVIISNKVGAKEIFKEEEKIEFVTEPNELYKILKKIITKEITKKITENISENIWIEHVKKIENLYRRREI